MQSQRKGSLISAVLLEETVESCQTCQKVRYVVVRDVQTSIIDFQRRVHYGKSSYLERH